MEPSADDQPTVASDDEVLGAPQEAQSLVGDRFGVGRLIGAGAHGAVYEAHDNEHGRRVALKLLLGMRGQDLYRFKQEFRALSDVSHPNLVTLYELFVEEQRAYFTMELVEGCDFLEWLRPGGAPDHDRIRDAFRQLGQGLSALHSFGRLHCDLKPSNVLVDADGSVLLADFGLTREFATPHGSDSSFEGTPAFMSPEQAAVEELGPPSDWYSVGAMLYAALTGERPFAGVAGLPLLMLKQTTTELRPSAVASGVPLELDELCCELLGRHPEDRPSGEAILARLGGKADPLPAEVPFVGREAELAQLVQALLATRRGEAQATFLSAQSGMGKSTLLRHFLAHAQRRVGAVVLAGRCYERESVPYRGVDALVDALWHAISRGRAAVAQDLPVDPAGEAALARLFPVWGRDSELRAARPAEDPIALRRQALAALGAILSHLARDRPVIVSLDDAQWIDFDSARLLVDLLRPAERPSILLLVCYRGDDIGPHDAPGALRQRLEAETEVRMTDVDLAPLSPAAAEDLARDYLGARADDHRWLADVTREAEGNPLFVVELARYFASLPVETAADVRFDDVIARRMDELPANCRSLLEAVAVAGAPLAQGIAIEAGGIEGGLEAISALRGRHFVRTRGASARDVIEPYHDRVRRAVIANLAPGRRVECHRRLADALEPAGAAPELIGVHAEAAQQPERAARHYSEAARQAGKALAFDRAARLYQRAIDLVPPTRELLLASAEALANAGRGAAAGHAYLDAVDYCDPADVLEIRRRAADQLLRAGRIEEGIAHLRGVARGASLWYPTGPVRAAASFLAQRLHIRARGLGYRAREAKGLPADLRLKLDTCWTAATGLILVNVVLGQHFQAMHLRLALEAGEPRRVARALGVETLYAGTAGEPGAKRTAELLAEVKGLARELDEPQALGIAQLAAGVADLYRGRFVEALPSLESAEALLRERCTNVAWELSMVRTFCVVTLYYLGELDAMAATMQRSIDDAIARDDIHTALMQRVAYRPIEYLALDDLDAARDELGDCQRRWPHELSGPTFRYVLMLTQSRVERYAGNGARAWAPFARHAAPVRRSLMLSKQPFRIFMLHDRGCSALAAAFDSDGPRRRRFIDIAADDAAALDAEGIEWARALARPLAAAVHAARGDSERAAAELRDAIDSFAAGQMNLYADACRLRLADLEPDGRQRQRIVAAMEDRGLTNAMRMADMLVPRVRGWST